MEGAGLEVRGATAPVFVQRQHGSRAIFLDVAERTIINILYSAIKTDFSRKENPFIYKNLFGLANRELSKAGEAPVSKATFARRVQRLCDLHLLQHLPHSQCLDVYDDEHCLGAIESLLFAHRIIEVRQGEIGRSQQVARFEAGLAKVKERYAGKPACGLVNRPALVAEARV